MEVKVLVTVPEADKELKVSVFFYSLGSSCELYELLHNTPPVLAVSHTSHAPHSSPLYVRCVVPEAFCSVPLGCVVVGNEEWRVPNGASGPCVLPGSWVGWHKQGPSLWLSDFIVKELTSPLSITLRSTRVPGFSSDLNGKRSANGCGVLKEMGKGVWVVQLKGTHRQRGEAHGELLAQHILDFLEFYVLENEIRSIEEYENQYIQFATTTMKFSMEEEEEMQGIYAGMVLSGADLTIPLLNRKFQYHDLKAVNSVLDRTGADTINCTQFAAFGSATQKTDLGGGLILGRNMDGELDFRKVTVTHVVTFARDSYPNTNTKKLLSVLWPGLTGSVSGVNEDGVYCMENCGNTRPGPPTSQIVGSCYSQRRFLEEFSAKDVQPEKALNFFNQFKCSSGGFNASGCLFLIASPNTGKENKPYAFIVEADRYDSDIRLPGDFRPHSPAVIMASNHYLKYGVSSPAKDPSESLIFSKPARYSSQWRYKVGMQTLEAWNRHSKCIDLQQMKALLQMTSHGTTEHSLIVVSKEGDTELYVAVASTQNEAGSWDGSCKWLWDAPYENYVRISLKELFQ
eukprot:TRINITY_DN14738_c0_g1_i1.p1 TRINITY_DN14738_c0_g1~~TRINITY_DN14738_c0_g1_i1.p1  ORF type:complete len:570 (+),score=134.32 TRINITY_DN14738_c0_g1_i1:1-1710(+)